MNTLRIPGSPTAEHHRRTYGDAPYDDFLDQWRAEKFDADALVALFARAGARYVVPTTKHHDGITLWDAPGTGTRTTVARGPRRDLVAEFAHATRAAGLRFGVYYSGGLDWHAADTGPIWDADDDSGARPLDLEYARYATAQVRDLIERYAPDVLWGDIDWPDAGKPAGPDSFTHVLDEFSTRATPRRRQRPVGRDPLGLPHERVPGGDRPGGDGGLGELRGVGLSFGYNQREDDLGLSLDGPDAVRHLVDVVSRGGTCLLNVGPDAAGRIPGPQRLGAWECLADWMAVNDRAVHGPGRCPRAVARPQDAPGCGGRRVGTASAPTRSSRAPRPRWSSASTRRPRHTSVQVLEAGPTGAREVPVQVTVRDGFRAGPAAPCAGAGSVVVQFRLR